DPKQAIYGFRGGDVQTYLQVKAEIQQAQRQGKGGLHGLTVNQRSVAPLVQAVDALFLRQTDLGDGIEYPAISAGERPHPALQDHSCSPTSIDNPQPLRLITLTESKQESQQIAWQVMHLLAQAAQGDLLLEGKPLQPEHIAVLGFANYELDQVQSLLQAANIAVWRPSRCSVFESPIAQDLAALLQSMLTPYHEQRLRRALSGVLIGWDLARLDQLDRDIGLLTQQQMAFADEGQLWERQGFLAAWQLLAERLDVWTHLASQPDAERHLVNLRHLLELLHEQSEHSGGTHHLLSWLMRQISQPKTREWEMERRLPSQSGVQLMTIHASKGLEFPVVLVQGLDKRRKKKTDVVFYLKPPVGQRAPQRVLGFNDQTPQHLEQHHARTVAEARRLAYVALTRASHRLYLPLLPTDKKLPADKHEAILTYWLSDGLPDWVAQQHERVRLEPLLDAAPDMAVLVNQSQPADVDSALVARPLPKRRLSSWGMTSFSAMIREHDQRHLAVIIEQPDHDQDVDQDVDEVSDDALLESMPERQAVDIDVGLVNVDTAQSTANIGVVDQATPSMLDWAGFEDGQFEDAQFDQRQAEWEMPEQFAPYDFEMGDVESPDVERGEIKKTGEVEPAPTEQNNLRLGVFSSAVRRVSAEDERPVAVDALTVPDWHDIPAPEDELPDIDPLEQFWLDDQVELPTLAESVPVQQLDDPVRFSFPRGATSGNCLHQILEYLDPSKDEDWARTFDKQLQAHAIHGIAAESMHAWFQHIVQAKLPDGATLAGLGFRERVREMEFYLALPSGEIDASRLLNRLAESGVHLPNLRHTHAVRYLKGSIDLVYQYNGQFYVADYKSNYLGGQLADYQPERLTLAMDHAGYWLQAALYLVALHRYLKVRLPDYRIEQHLGGANYLFLRGMRADDAEHGILAWRPEPRLIEDLDAILAGQSLRSRANV
ncbi:MAG: 3'-5' exonuclease, partial [Pseudomonadota bacterium]|nr:3'-5' exonuclease [Pseudomonadota bacterium]